MVIRNTITDGQIASIYSIGHRKGMDSKKLHKVVLHLCKKEHVRELTTKQADYVIGYISRQKNSFIKRKKPYTMTELQRTKVNAIYEQILSKGKIYELENLSKHITGESDLEKLDTVKASKLIGGLNGILKSIKSGSTRSASLRANSSP